MKVISVIGSSGSGKTTTIERIIAELKRRGYSVGSVKDIHFEGFAIDTEGTNTYRHRQAGSELVTARGLAETDVLIPSRLPMDAILSFYDHDYVILEGVEDYHVPRIVCGTVREDLKERMDAVTLAFSGRVSGTLEAYHDLPVLDARTQTEELVDLIEDRTPHRLPNVDPECCSRCGLSCREMLAAILRGERERSDCQLRPGAVRLFIDDEEVPMVEFVRSILRDAVLAVAGNLKGYREHGSIRVEIDREG